MLTQKGGIYALSHCFSKCGSVVMALPGMWRALGSMISYATKNNKTKQNNPKNATLFWWDLKFCISIYLKYSVFLMSHETVVRCVLTTPEVMAMF
jgi:hypothetical protein